MNEPQPKRRRRWYQFSLRTLMLFMVVCAIPSAWVGWKLEATRRERVAEYGPFVQLMHARPLQATWGARFRGNGRSVLLRDVFASVVSILLLPKCRQSVNGLAFAP